MNLNRGCRKPIGFLFLAAIGMLMSAACTPQTANAPTTLAPAGPAPITIIVASESGPSSSIENGVPMADSSLLIDSDQLIGLPVVGTSGNPAGAVADVLVDSSGAIRSVILGLSGAAASVAGATANSPASTAVLNGTEYLAVDWSQFTPDPANDRLVYQGTTSALMESQAFNELAVCNDYLIPDFGAGAEGFAGLWRLAAPLNTVNLQDMTGASLGGWQTVVLDLNHGQALYAVLDMAHLANSGPSASSDAPLATGVSGRCANSGGASAANSSPANLVAVPFANLSVSTGSGNPLVTIEAPAPEIQGAPNLNSYQFPMWPQMAPPGWNTLLNSYWGIVGS